MMDSYNIYAFIATLYQASAVQQVFQVHSVHISIRKVTPRDDMLFC